MRRFYTVMMASLLAFGLAGCSNMNNQQGGTLVGAVAGGLLGSQFGGGSGQIAATLLGTAAGAYIGNQVGANMDETDRLKANQAIANNRRSSWTNPSTGGHYTVVPTKTFQGDVVNNQHQVVHKNVTCREFTFESTDNNQHKTVKGTACKNAQGEWQVLGK